MIDAAGRIAILVTTATTAHRGARGGWAKATEGVVRIVPRKGAFPSHLRHPVNQPVAIHLQHGATSASRSKMPGRAERPRGSS